MDIPLGFIKNRIYRRSKLENKINRTYSNCKYELTNYNGSDVKIEIDNIKLRPKFTLDSPRHTTNSKRNISRMRVDRWIESIVWNKWMTFVNYIIRPKQNNILCPEGVELSTASLISHRIQDHDIDFSTREMQYQDKYVSDLSMFCLIEYNGSYSEYQEKLNYVIDNLRYMQENMDNIVMEYLKITDNEDQMQKLRNYIDS